MKNQFGNSYISLLANEALEVTPSFAAKKFIQDANSGLDKLEMKDRIRQIGKAYFNALENNYELFYRHSMAIFNRNPLTGQHVWQIGIKYEPLAYIVEHHGLPWFDFSMQLMREITMRYTSEFAIRSFIAEYPSRTLETLLEWAGNDNEHLRRLASEGSRSRLPWARKLSVIISDPSLTRPILERLKADKSKYVQRSVANHLNDISKDNPDYFYNIITDWAKSKDRSTAWIIKHALRNEIKKGHPKALALLGFSNATAVVESFQLSSPSVLLGGELTLDLEIKNPSQAHQNLVVDFGIHLVKKSGNRFFKVFKWKTFEAKANSSYKLTKKLNFKPLTTRTYYPGEHEISVIINGKPGAVRSVKLI